MHYCKLGIFVFGKANGQQSGLYKKQLKIPDVKLRPATIKRYEMEFQVVMGCEEHSSICSKNNDSIEVTIRKDLNEIEKKIITYNDISSQLMWNKLSILFETSAEQVDVRLSLNRLFFLFGCV